MTLSTIAVILILIGIYQIVFAAIMQTKNLRSAVLFKAIPLLQALFVMLVGLGLYLGLGIR